MKLSKFGEKMTSGAGILSLMDDLGEACRAGRQMIMMGGGNPGVVAEFQQRMREQLLEIAQDPHLFKQLTAGYAPPQGDFTFLEDLASLLHEELGWDIGPENLCLTNGSQTAFFMLFNLFAGEMSDGSFKKICLPLAPEYIGYADLGIASELFVSSRPEIELLDGGMFKYHIDFKNLQLGPEVGAICVSRPTNPTGNVISDREVQGLIELARANDIPLIIDSAYGLPFPGMIYTEATPVWNESLVVCLSLSKLGLPAVRTGIVVASKEIVRALVGMNAIMSLSPTSFGAMLARKMVSGREIIEISKNMMQPFYSRKMEKAVAVVKEKFAGLPCRIHKPEGAMFLWLWFENLPITSLELYERLKDHGVLVVSGHFFFPGLQEEWRHRHECLRVTYSQDDDTVARGLGIIADVVRNAYDCVPLI